MTTPSTGSSTEPISRRRVLVTTGVLTASSAVVVACGSSSSTPSASSGGGGDGAGVTVAKDQVPVGGGVILGDQGVVVTQPEAGTFKAFSAVCTHQGCTVAGIQNGSIVCPCHGGMFSITDGSVQGGPPPAPLDAKTVSVSDTTITVT
jgi:Rieske Fe-S protein